MNPNKARIKLKINEIEIEYEGQENFIKDELPNIIDKLAEHFNDINFTSPNNKSLPKGDDLDSFDNSNTVIDRSVSSIAISLNVANAPDLIIAAAAFLTFSKSKETFSRQDIHQAMKSAKGHYHKNMGSNLAKNLTSLVGSKRLNESSNGEYALTVKERMNLEKSLA